MVPNSYSASDGTTTVVISEVIPCSPETQLSFDSDVSRNAPQSLKPVTFHVMVREYEAEFKCKLRLNAFEGN